MTKYYDFSFHLQPPIFSHTQKFFIQILNTQAQHIASALPSSFLLEQTQESCQTTQTKPKVIPTFFAYHLYISQDSQPTLHYIIETNYTQALLDFADSLSLHLPISLGFSFTELKTLDSLDTNLTPIAPIDYKPQTHFYSVKQTQDFLSSEHFADFSLFTLAKPLFNTNDIITYLTQEIHNLKTHQTIFIDTARGIKACSLIPLKDFQDNDCVCVMCDIASLKTFFRIHTTQSDILASFEKPMLRLPPKEVFKDKFALDSYGLVLTSLPYDAILQLLAALLLREEITHFFLYDTAQTPKKTFNHTPQDSRTLCVSENGLFLDTTLKQECDFKTLLHTNLSQSSSECAIVLYVSSKHPSAILLKEGAHFKQILHTEFECNPKLLIESIHHHYQSGDELVKNFLTKTPLPLLESLDESSVHTDNLTHIFGIAALLLGMHPYKNLQSKQLLEILPTAYTSLVRYANEFIHPKGPRIDYILLKDSHNTLTLDYPRIFRSSMSFKCAGMENIIIAYGFIDSFCEFLASLVRDMQTNYALGDNLEVLLCGDVFAHTIFFERILGFLPKNIKLTLPQDGFLDFITKTS